MDFVREFFYAAENNQFGLLLGILILVIIGLVIVYWDDMLSFFTMGESNHWDDPWEEDVTKAEQKFKQNGDDDGN